MQFSWPSVANLAKDLVTPLPFLLIRLPHRDIEKTEYYKSHYSHAVIKEKWMFLEGAINLVPFQLHDSESGHAQLSQRNPVADVWKGMKGVAWKFLGLCLLLKTLCGFDHRKQLQHSHGGHSSFSCACEESEKEEEHKANKRC